jgi:drug/metabolite transporter (DMT)-like permease
MMISEYYGELAALATAVFWSVTALSFEVASRRVGSLAVNMIRLVFAFVFLGVFSFFHRGMILPLDATVHAYVWLSISGLIGFVFGDYFLFRAFAMISSRIAMLIMTLVPPITALIGWLMLDEVLNLLEVTGMFLTIGGISLAIISRKNAGGKLKLSYPLKGILFALAGTVGQAVGLVLSKYGMQDYDAFAATHIRIFAGMLGFAVIVVSLGKTKYIRRAFKDRKGMLGISSGSFFGPFLGVSFSLLAIQYTATGIASTIMSIVPILLIPPSILLFKQKVSSAQIVGAFVSVFGVMLFFL